MPYELYQPDQAVRMLLSGIEFISLLSAFIIAGVLLISSGLAIWLGYSERRQRRGRRRTARIDSKSHFGKEKYRYETR